MLVSKLHCDRCHCADGVKTLNLVIGREMDAAGSMGDDVVSMDLCPNCQLLLMEEFIKYADHCVVNMTRYTYGRWMATRASGFKAMEPRDVKAPVPGEAV